MTTIVLNDETAKTSIGDVLRSATGPEIELTDESGRLIGRIVLETTPGETRCDKVIVLGAFPDPGNREGDVTTQQLLENLRQLDPE